VTTQTTTTPHNAWASPWLVPHRVPAMANVATCIQILDTVNFLQCSTFQHYQHGCYRPFMGKWGEWVGIQLTVGATVENCNTAACSGVP